MRAAVSCRRRARAHYAFARLHYRRLRPVLGHAVLGRCARRFPRCHRRSHNPCRLPSTRPLTTTPPHWGQAPLWWFGTRGRNRFETQVLHVRHSKRLYLHRNQNETSARRLMRNFAATVRYYPYSIKFAAHRVPRPTFFVSHHWRKHELHAESSRRAQGPLSRAA